MSKSGHHIHSGEHSSIAVTAMPGKGLALLSLEFGLAECLGSLQLLKDFMDSIAEIKGLDGPPEPCRFFDMIGGCHVGALGSHPNCLAPRS